MRRVGIAVAVALAAATFIAPAEAVVGGQPAPPGSFGYVANVRVGGEFQAGVYGNHANMVNTLSTNLIPPGTFGHMLSEKVTDTQVAFIGQANLLATYRLNYQWTIRTGYQFLFVDGVALAAENFNPVPLGTNNPFRPHVPNINVNGDVFYHGWNVGLEYMW